MSIEYTIDLQLTELGFPDILLPDKSCDHTSLTPEGDDQRLPAAAQTEATHPDDHRGTHGPSEESDSGPGLESDSDSSDASEADDEERAESSCPDGYSCSICSLQLSSRSKLLDHMDQHRGNQFSCSKCGKTFCQVTRYRLHLRTHAKLKAKFFCRVCQIGYSTLKDLRNHLATAHLENEFFECDNCKHVFTTLSACQKHVEQRTCVENLYCKVCGQSFTSRSSYLRHRKSTCIFSHKCKVCLKTFIRKNTLLRHSFSHLGCLPYTCFSCHTHFKKANLYHAHKCKTQPINCRVCLREFVNADDFQRHIKDTGCWGNQESSEDGIRCLECGKMFHSAEELRQHSSAHQKVLKCAECGKGFRSALLLMSHMGGHAGSSPCLCQRCGLGFPHQQNFHSHLKTCEQESKPSSKLMKQRLSSASDSNLDLASISPHLSTEAATTPDSSDGCWKLTLDKDPPPGSNLLLFLPVCMPLTDNVAAQPAACDTTDPGAAQHDPLNLAKRAKQDPDQEVPLDFSNSTKSTTSDISVLPVKSEPEESEISGSPLVSGDTPALASDIKEELESQNSEMS